MKNYQDKGLLIVGHGSTENPDSSKPYLDHAQYIREQGIFKEVHCCFWKEEPSLREADYLFESDEIYVVPDFISEGYFTQEVIPRELELENRTQQRHGKTYHYCDPVGIHPSMTDRLLERADKDSKDELLENCTLIVVGHGTGLNKNSIKSIQDQVELIRQTGKFHTVLDAYMEQAPFIKDWSEISPTETVIVVPFFIADGLHSYQDIPVMLGMQKDEGLAASQRSVFRNNPYYLQSKTLYFCSSIGTDPQLGEVILEQVSHFDKNYLNKKISLAVPV